jgi:hypothetical protein
MGAFVGQALHLHYLEGLGFGKEKVNPKGWGYCSWVIRWVQLEQAS